MAELTEQQVHLQQVLEQQQQLSQEAQRLNTAVQNNNAMFTKSKQKKRKCGPPLPLCSVIYFKGFSSLRGILCYTLSVFWGLGSKNCKRDGKDI